MSKWLIKALLQRSFSISKHPEKINRVFQKYLTGKDKLDDTKFSNKILHATDHLTYYQQYGNKALSEITCMELGTGQFPIVPIFYFLHGINSIVSIDIVSFMTLDRIAETLNYYIDYRKKYPEKFNHVIEERWQQLTQVLTNFKQYSRIEEVLAVFKCSIYIADARKTTYANNSFDFITSNNTFEHIYPEILLPILKEFQRILTPNGIMSHFIDMTDHFAHFDNRISVYNFLKFSDRLWRMLDNEILPQSRLRFKDYATLYQEVQIPIVHNKIWKYNSSPLTSLKLNKKFKHYTLDELAIVHIYIVSTKD